MPIEYEKSPADAESENNSAVSAPGRSPAALLPPLAALMREKLASVSYSPGRSARASLRPLGAARAEPSQVQCCTLTEIAR